MNNKAKQALAIFVVIFLATAAVTDWAYRKYASDCVDRNFWERCE